MSCVRDIRLVLIFGILSTYMYAEASTVEYKLAIAQQEVNITGRPAQGMTINGGIPGPTLRFKEGDTARIHVENNMDVDTSIHWHGILVPPDMDGVPYISFPPIRPGKTFTYEFPIRQSGTYWYHSHTSLQEQSGVYGSIVIEPIRNDPKSDRDYVVVLSDWTNDDPHDVNRTLKRGSEWYSIEKRSGQSILGAARMGALGDYFKRELQRMPPMDIADVAYDRFLANGKPESTLHAEPNETVRLRIIDGSSTTYFHLQFAGGPVTIVAADGIDVEPVKENRFLIGVAETYDVLIQVPASGAYEFRATAHDGSGYSSVWIGSGQRHPAPDVPRPNLYKSMGDVSLKSIFSLTPAGAMGMSDREVAAGKFDQPGMMGGMDSMDDMDDMKSMDGMDGMEHMEHMNSMDGLGDMKGMDGLGDMKGMDSMDDTKSMKNASDSPNMKMGGMQHASSKGEEDAQGMDHADHSMPNPPQSSQVDKKQTTGFGFLAADVSSSKDLAVDGMDPSRPWPPYAKLRATAPTAFNKDKPVHEVRLTLDGDMERYVWFFNNKPLSESDSILIHKGEVVRFIMINRTMMHHPMHLHGHFFRVINGQGDYAPLKHTADVSPMSTTVIEFDANEFGDWFFHCHLLYHMMSGMARVVHYESYTIDPYLSQIRPKLYKDHWYFWGQADALSHMTEGFLMFSNIRNILTAEWDAGWQEVDDTEWEGILTWDRYINRFFTLFGGVDLLGAGDEHEKTRGVFGMRYLLPLNLESWMWVDTDGGARFSVEKSFALTPRLALTGETQYDSHEKWEGSTGLSYLVLKNFSISGRWHSEYGFGGGLQIRF